MKPLFPILLALSLVGCERKPLALAQGQTVEQLNPGSTVRCFRNGSSSPSAIVRKADGSVWLYIFQNGYVKDPSYEEELIPATQPKTN